MLFLGIDLNKNATVLQSAVKFLAHQVVLFCLHLLADYLVTWFIPTVKEDFSTLKQSGEGSSVCIVTMQEPLLIGPSAHVS